MMIRLALPILFSFAMLTTEAGAQGVGLDPNTLRPSFRMPLSGNTNSDTFRRLPYQDLGSEIRIELPAGALYDFDKGEIPSSADDYFQQAANLIFEEAKGQVRIECRSDRDPPAIGQKLAERCANAIVQRMVVQEKLTKVKFTAVGTRLSPAAIAPNTNNLLAPKPNSRPSVTIVFMKK